MATDDKKTKAAPDVKTEAKPAAADASASKPASSEKTSAPKSSYGGEGQKPASQAYKDNWNAIFAKKAPKSKKRR